MVAAVLQDLLSPDVAKEHAVEPRVGVLYNADVDPGTQGPGNTWTLQADLTPRLKLPAGFLVSLRNRVSFNWLVQGATGSYFRYRGRLQLEREFDVARVPITPFVNAEVVWQHQPAMWTQFRMQGRLRSGSSSRPTSDPWARIGGSKARPQIHARPRSRRGSPPASQTSSFTCTRGSFRRRPSRSR